MATRKKAAPQAAPEAFTSEKPRRGRPRTTLAKLPEDWEDRIRTLAQEGAGRCEWQCALGISNVGYLTLLEDSPYFREVISECKLLAQAWWERLGRKGAAGKAEINGAVWALNMKNRFRWRDSSVAEVRGVAAVAAQPKAIVRTVLPAVQHTPHKFDVPGDQGVVE